MKKSDLIKLIKEAVEEELINEQVQGPFEPGHAVIVRNCAIQAGGTACIADSDGGATVQIGDVRRTTHLNQGASGPGYTAVGEDFFITNAPPGQTCNAFTKSIPLQWGQYTCTKCCFNPWLGPGNLNAPNQGDCWVNGCSSNTPPIWGCTDSTAFNYDSNAQQDDGNCDYGWKCGQLVGGGAMAEQVSMPTGCFPGTSTDPGVFANEGHCLSQNTNIPNGCGGTGTGMKKAGECTHDGDCDKGQSCVNNKCKDGGKKDNVEKEKQLNEKHWCGGDDGGWCTDTQYCKCIGEKCNCENMNTTPVDVTSLKKEIEEAVDLLLEKKYGSFLDARRACHTDCPDGGCNTNLVMGNDGVNYYTNTCGSVNLGNNNLTKGDHTSSNPINTPTKPPVHKNVYDYIKESIKSLMKEDIEEDCQQWYQGHPTEYNNFISQCCDTQEGCTTYPTNTCGAWASTATTAVPGLDPCDCCDVEVTTTSLDCSVDPTNDCWVCHGDPTDGGSCIKVGNANSPISYFISAGFTFYDDEPACLAAGPECGPTIDDTPDDIKCYKCKDGAPVGNIFPGPDCPTGWESVTTFNPKGCRGKTSPSTNRLQELNGYQCKLS